MKTCLKCNESFPNRVIIDGSTKNISKRKYCLKCSPFGIKNTKQLHKSTIGKTLICHECEGEYVRVKGRNTNTYCEACKTRIYRQSLKQKAVDYKGGRCQHCGYKKCLDALHFHHEDPNEKDVNPSRLYDKSWETLKKEIEKCILLCANCHFEEHARLRKFKRLTKRAE